MNSYELMIIFTPVLSDEEFKQEQKKYSDLILSNGGEVVDAITWGLRALAYPIQKKTTGIYWIVEYKADPSFNEKLLVQLKRDEQVMRNLIYKLDKHAVLYNYNKRNGLLHNEIKAEE